MRGFRFKNIFWSLIVCLVFVIALFFAAHKALALELTYPGFLGIDENTTLPKLIRNLYATSVYIGGLLAFGVLVWAGLLFMTSLDKPGQQLEAKKRMIGAAVGAFILFAAYIGLALLSPDLLFLPENALPPLPGDIVGKLPCEPPTTPTINLNASPTSVAPDGSTTLTWSSNVCNCVGISSPDTNLWKGPKSNRGSEKVSGLKEHTTFTLSCEPPISTAKVTVKVETPGPFTCKPDPTTPDMLQCSGTITPQCSQNQFLLGAQGANCQTRCKALGGSPAYIGTTPQNPYYCLSPKKEGPCESGSTYPTQTIILKQTPGCAY